MHYDIEKGKCYTVLNTWKESRGSLYELKTQLYLSSDLKCISEKELKNTLEQITIVNKLLAGFINHYKKKL